MTNFLIISAMSMGVLLAMYYLLFEREKMHRFNRFYLLGALVFSLALPFISITIPEYVEIPEPEPVIIEEPAPIAEVSHEAVPTIAAPYETVAPVVSDVNYWPYIGWGIYAMATLALGIRFFWNIRRFYNIKSKNATVPYKGATLVLLEESVLPHTFFSNIFVNRKDYESRLIEPELFTHELTHVRQYHTLDILFVELLRTVFWFNPLLFLYKRAIRLNHEFLADETTIKEHCNIPVYQQLLLSKSGPASVHALASSINFSITKKRFIMMTKTTNKTKGVLLRLTVLPASAALIFTLSVQTVTYAKAVNGKAMFPVIEEEANSVIPEIPDEETIAEEQESPAVAVRDSATARRDEYYKGVRVVIDDKSRNLHIDKPYEKLTDEQKELYLAEAPEKKAPRAGVQKVDYDFYLSEKDAVFYIDDQKVSTDIIKNHKPEDFVSYRSRHSFSDGIKLSQVFFYTSPYFEKNIRHAYDHYPDSTYKITVLDKALDYTESRKLAGDIPNDGKTDMERSKERLKEEKERQSYSYKDYVRENNRSTSPKFPLEKGDFHKYFADNFKMKDKIGDKQLFILMSINTDGSVSDVNVRDVEPEVEAEIKRILENSPRWIPAQENGHAVKMGYTINYPEKRNY